MNSRQELLAFLEELLADLKQKKAGLRKTDLVEEVIGILSKTEDEAVIRQQLLRLDELVKQTEPEDGEGRGQEEYWELAAVIQSAHKESVMMERRFLNGGEPLCREAERSLQELEQVSAAYQDLISTERLRRRTGMIKERYVREARGRQEQLAKDVSEEYEHAVGKVQNMILYSKDDGLRLSQKELYETHGSSHDTFLANCARTEQDGDLTGGAFEALADSIGKKAQRVLKRKTCLMALILILTIAGWAGGIGTMAYQVNQAVEQSVSESDVVSSSVEKLGAAGTVIQFAAGEDTLEEMDREFGDSASEAIYELMKYILKVMGIVILCFYIILIPVLLWARKKSCIKALEKAVHREVEGFLQKGMLQDRLREAAHETVLRVEAMYAKEYQDLYDRILENAGMENGPDSKNRTLGARWRQMKKYYISDREER